MSFFSNKSKEPEKWNMDMSLLKRIEVTNKEGKRVELNVYESNCCNKEWMFSLSDEELIPLLISSKEIDDGDYYDDDDYEPCYKTYYVSPSGYRDTDYNSVYDDVKEWLYKEHNS